MQNLFLGQIALKRPWVRGAHSRSPRLAGSSPKLGEIRWLAQVSIAKPRGMGSANLGARVSCTAGDDFYKIFEDCNLVASGTAKDLGIVIKPPPCVNGYPSSCPQASQVQTQQGATTPPVVNTSPPPSSGVGITCCVVKGPGGNQIKRCYNEGCGLNWVSSEGIYPGVPECAADGRPKSCSPAATGAGIPAQPLQQAPGPSQVPLNQNTSPQQMTNVYNGQTRTTTAQNPTGAGAGDPFRAVAPRTPVQAMPLPASPGTSQVQIAPPPAQAPQVPVSEECPEEAQSLERWAQACAMAHRR